MGMDKTVDRSGREIARFAEPVDLHVDALLTQLAIDYANEEAAFVANRVLPRLSVNRESDKYAVYGKEALRLEGDLKRAPKTLYATADWDVTTEDFRTEEYGVTYPMDDRERLNADAGMDPDQASTRKLMGIMLVRREADVRDLISNTAVVTQNTTPAAAAKWSTESSSDPLAAVDTARTAIRRATARNPNCLLLGAAVWDVVKRHPALLSLVKVTDGMVTRQMAAQLFEVDEIIVGGAIYDSANGGQAYAGADIWGKDAWLFYRTASPSLYEPSAGYQLVFEDLVTERFRADDRRLTVIRTRENRDEVVVDAGAIYYFKSVIA